MKDANRLQLQAPRVVSGRALLIAGLRGHFTRATWAAAPGEWQRFVM
jgi:hypothetical protein